MRERLEATVHGFVQGVGFRYFIKRNAVRLGLVGFAENLFNGDVKVVAEGEKEKLEELLVLLKRGNDYSEVEKVDFSFKEYKGEFNSFVIY